MEMLRISCYQFARKNRSEIKGILSFGLKLYYCISMLSYNAGGHKESQDLFIEIDILLNLQKFF